jgi:hypothetical protein
MSGAEPDLAALQAQVARALVDPTALAALTAHPPAWLAGMPARLQGLAFAGRSLAAKRRAEALPMLGAVTAALGPAARARFDAFTAANRPAAGQPRSDAQRFLAVLATDPTLPAWLRALARWQACRVDAARPGPFLRLERFAWRVDRQRGAGPPGPGVLLAAWWRWSRRGRLHHLRLMLPHRRQPPPALDPATPIAGGQP